MQWIVLRDPIEVSPEQVAAFLERYTNGARPLQERFRRYLLANF